MRYVLLDPATSTVLKVGEAEKADGGEFTVTIDSETTKDLPPGLYSLFLAAFSDEIASLVERKVDLDVAP